MIDPLWKKYIDDTRPGHALSETEMATIYLREVRGIEVQRPRPPANFCPHCGQRMPRIKPKEVVENAPSKDCPQCGTEMAYFRLCGMCHLAVSTGNKAIWICPNSRGTKQKVNEMELGGPGDRTYKDLFIAYKK